MATEFGVDKLQELFTGTLILTLIASPVFAWLTDTFKPSRELPGVFWFLVLNLVGFYFWFEAAPDSRWLQASFYWWVSVNNLFMISVFWSLIVDVFTPAQSSRMLPTIAAGGSLGAIAGPLVASLFVRSVGVPVLLLIAAAGAHRRDRGVHLLMREKVKFQQARQETQVSTLDHELKGTLLDGFAIAATAMCSA